MKNQLISTVNFAQSVKNAVYLIKNLWKQHTTLLVHAPRCTDKTEKVLEIAAEVVSADRPAVYINTEDSLDAHLDRLVTIDGLSVLTPSFQSADDTTDYADLVISAIEEIIAETDIRTFFIDSVTRIAALSFGRNASAAYVMKRLVALQLRTGCSFLIISHDSTKAADRALSNLATSELSEFPEPSNDSTTTPVGSRPVATATDKIKEPSDCSEYSDCSEFSEYSESSDSTKSSEYSEFSEPSESRLSRRRRRQIRREKCRKNKKISQNFNENFGG